MTNARGKLVASKVSVELVRVYRVDKGSLDEIDLNTFSVALAHAAPPFSADKDHHAECRRVLDEVCTSPNLHSKQQATQMRDYLAWKKGQ